MVASSPHLHSRLTTVAIWVPLHCCSAVGLFQIIVRAIVLHAKHVVRVQSSGAAEAPACISRRAAPYHPSRRVMPGNYVLGAKINMTRAAGGAPTTRGKRRCPMLPLLLRTMLLPPQQRWWQLAHLGCSEGISPRWGCQGRPHSPPWAICVSPCRYRSTCGARNAALAAARPERG